MPNEILTQLWNGVVNNVVAICVVLLVAGPAFLWWLLTDRCVAGPSIAKLEAAGLLKSREQLEAEGLELARLEQERRIHGVMQTISRRQYERDGMTQLARAERDGIVVSIAGRRVAK